MFRDIYKITKEELQEIMVKTNNKRWLSKSQIGIFCQCPQRWKLQYLDRLPQTPNKYQERGTNIHKEIEGFYKNIKLVKKKGGVPDIIIKKDMKDIEKFVEFEKKRIKDCKNKEGKFDLKYFKPIAQELAVKDKDLMLRGFIDAVYINPKDDGLIIIDWKSGKYRPYNLSEYRFELAVYKELLEKSGKVDGKVLYWGIYFVDADKLFFEKVKDVTIKAMYKKIEKVRKDMDSGKYPCKPGVLCKWCDYHNICEAWKNVV